ncbi:MAG: rRNA (guanosine-2-O-)-methyltransferase RlmB [Verrucomicrobiota bacterium]
MSDEVIQSRQNPRIQAVARLRDRPEREARGLFIAEGLRELSRARERQVEVLEVYFCPELFRRVEAAELVSGCRAAGIDCCEVGRSAFEKISGREGPDGLLGIAKTWDCSLERLQLSANALLLVAESVEKPGNLGALLRTADSAGCDALIVCDPITDLFNPNVVRSSQGALFSVPVAVCTSQQAAAWMKAKGVRSLATSPAATKAYWDVDCRGPVALLLGSEKDGLTDFWLKGADEKISIPQAGLSDSLNVSNAAAICLFEAVRQRRNPAQRPADQGRP